MNGTETLHPRHLAELIKVTIDNHYWLSKSTYTKVATMKAEGRVILNLADDLGETLKDSIDQSVRQEMIGSEILITLLTHLAGHSDILWWLAKLLWDDLERINNHKK